MSSTETMANSLADHLSPILADVEDRIAVALARLESYRGEPEDMGSTEQHCCQRVERARVAELRWVDDLLMAAGAEGADAGPMPEIIEVIRPGTTVLVGGDIEAVVLDFSIGAFRQQYQVAWWDGRNRNEQWVDSPEVRPRAGEVPRQAAFKVGFLTTSGRS